MMDKAARIGEVCARHGVPLKAAALQFILAHPAIVSVIPGARSIQEVEDNVRMVELPIPGALWAELKEQRLDRPGRADAEELSTAPVVATRWKDDGPPLVGAARRREASADQLCHLNCCGLRADSCEITTLTSAGPLNAIACSSAVFRSFGFSTK